jgi:hypothetical protein
MSVSGANADADEVVPMPMVQPLNRLSKMIASVYRSVGGDDFCTRQETKSVFAQLRGEVNGWYIEMRYFTEYVQYLY